ncbi:MAG: biotin/lipoyl attachment domain protein [Acidobacteriaceae bacterium]|nr:biotin/lipoyl attachment domain protein [Acidobacteriaceae bacterium]
MRLDVEVDGSVRQLELEHDGAGYVIRTAGRAIPAELCELMPGVLSLLMEGRSFRCVHVQSPDERMIAVGGQQYRVAVMDPRSLRERRKRSGVGNGKLLIKASIPGRVARVLVAAGDEVAAHQAILVIEAMKMQNELKAARDGRVAEVRVAAGETVAAGQVLAILE